MTRRILFVDDEPRILVGLERLLAPRRAEWAMQFVTTPQAALAACEESPFDVVVTDMNMPEMDGTALLEHVLNRWPTTVRIVLSGQNDLEGAARISAVAHQFMRKPCDPAELYQVVERLCVLQHLLGTETLRQVVGSVSTLPSVPRVYTNLERAIRNSEAGLAPIAAIIEKDTALSAKVLQLVNSSFFGRARRVLRVEQAVGFLGVNIIRSLVLSHEIANAVVTAGASPALSLQHEQEHAMLTAGIARRLVTPGPDADNAFMAGVLHDVGKLLLAAKMPAQYDRIAAEATAKRRPMHEVEMEHIGATHAELGAYLLALWGIPPEIVTAVAHHHQPSRHPAAVMNVLAAVHVADVLAHELASPDAKASAGTIDEAYLARIGGLDLLPEWRRAAVEVWSAR